MIQCNKFSSAVTLFLAAVAMCWHLVVLAEPVLAKDPPAQALGMYASYLVEHEGALDISGATAAFGRGVFVRGDSPVLNFGIGSLPVWIRFEVDNRTEAVLQRRLSVETSWLDKVDVYVLSGNSLVNGYKMGDGLPFSERPVDSPFFAVDHGFQPGMNEVFIRVETSDPMLVPIHLHTAEVAFSLERRDNYSYGLVYGFLLALIAYNLMLYFGLGTRRYLFYSLYLASFVLLNIAYTGHGFEWLWPENVDLQRWIIPCMMEVYGMTGLLFAIHFLDIRRNFPGMYLSIILICGFFGTLLFFSWMFEFNTLGLNSAFLFVFVFSLLMIMLGVMGMRSGQAESKYFLLGAISATLGALITDISVAGFITHNAFTYRAVEIGMLLDGTLLALALSYQYRILHSEKSRAELMAKSDPLTSLNNRRAFYDISRPIWSTSLRSRRDVSIIMLDIDNFKNINDGYGHNCGDEVLIAVGSILARSAREGDVLARWGGEEFILLLPETKLDSAVALAERLRMAIAGMHIASAKGTVSFTASFGVAEREESCNSINELVAKADELLLQAKRAGRNQVSHVAMEDSPLIDVMSVQVQA